MQLRLIIDALRYFDIEFDEGAGFPDGARMKEMHMDHISRDRELRYITHMSRNLVEKGLAYPCFCTEDELAKRKTDSRKTNKVLTGYYGEYADMPQSFSYEEIEREPE